MKTNKGMVLVPQMTLNTLKQMLFSNENGVDLTNIINDLAVEDDQKDLVAINVALVHNGIQPEIDTAVHYEYSYGNRFSRFEFVKSSLILGTITCIRTDCAIGEHGDIEIGRQHSDLAVLNYERWCSLPTDVKDILAQMK
jgi:hypothetical protein